VTTDDPHALTATDVTVGAGVQLRYACALDRLPAALVERFVPLAHDAAAAAFVARSLAAPHGALRTTAYGLLRRVLSDYDAYGLLGMFPMHLWSTPQLHALLAAATRVRDYTPRGRLLDVGAGDGGITAHTAPGFDEVLATESSAPLRRRLRRRGYRVLDHDLGRSPLPAALAADVVTCLNVLDRTPYPRTLLTHLRAALRPNGVLIVSLPLPLRPHVQRAGHTADPEEPLPDTGDTFETGIARLHDALLTPHALTLRAFSRLPYLCHGDTTHTLYALDAAVLLCTADAPGGPIR